MKKPERSAHILIKVKNISRLVEASYQPFSFTSFYHVLRTISQIFNYVRFRLSSTSKLNDFVRFFMQNPRII